MLLILGEEADMKIDENEVKDIGNEGYSLYIVILNIFIEKKSKYSRLFYFFELT